MVASGRQCDASEDGLLFVANLKVKVRRSAPRLRMGPRERTPTVRWRAIADQPRGQTWAAQENKWPDRLVRRRSFGRHLLSGIESILGLSIGRKCGKLGPKVGFLELV